MIGVLRMLAILCTALASPGDLCAAGRPNVLLITIDACRPANLGAYGYDRDTSPALDALSRDGVVLEQAISSSSWTTPGLLSVLTGLWAPTHGVDVRGRSLRAGTATLASLLRKAGYAAPDILYLSSLPNFRNLGLTASYTDRDRYLPDGDQVLFKALEAYQDSTFFLYYHYRNVHLPFNPSPPYDRMFTPDNYDRSGLISDKVAVIKRDVTIPVGSVLFGPEDQEWITGLYDGQIREMDDTFFGPLVATLKRLGLYDSTLVIVTADHGEELLDHGFVGHPSTSFKGSAYDELLRIPLIMVCPSLLPASHRVATQVQNVDIMPTVLDLLDLAQEPTAQGRSLLPLIMGEASDERPAFTETTPGGYQATPEMMKTRIRAMRTSDWKLIHTLGPGVDRYELYDLAHDPEEKHDLAGRQVEVLAAMRAELHRWALGAQAEPAMPEPKRGVSRLPSEPVRVLFPADGDSIRYVDVGKAISIKWTGPSDRDYTIEYLVGEGSYRIEGEMTVTGASAQYGPYTEEMWNMLALYNPWSFRVRVDEVPRLSSPWTRFRIVPTASGPTPGRFMLAAAYGAFLWSEAWLLVAGLATACGLLVMRVGDIPLVWIVSGALTLAIAAGICQDQLRRLGRVRALRWSVVVAYTGVVYLTLPAMPQIWGAVWRLTKGRVDYVSSIVLAIAAAGLLIYLVARCRRLLPFVLIPAVAVCYLYVLSQLQLTPAERFHLTEYGVLSWIVFRALRVDMPGTPAYLTGVLISGLLGVGDEAIQWLLPMRVFEWKDIGLNVFSSAMGMVLVALVVYSRPGRKA